MKAGPQADAFGELLVTQLRDQAIEHFDGLAAGHWKAPALLALQQQLAELDQDTISIIRRCVVQAVDSGIGHFLFRLQECTTRASTWPWSSTVVTSLPRATASTARSG